MSFAGLVRKSKMDKRSRLFRHLLAVTLIVATGVGAYGYSVQHRLDATLDSIGALELDRNLWKAKAERAEGLVDNASTSLNQCSAKVEDLTRLLATASPRISGGGGGHTAE